MANIPDDLYLGYFEPQGLTLGSTASANPTLNQGVGPAGRVFSAFNGTPLTAQTNNIATSQHMTSGTSLTLTAGTGVTSQSAPDGSGSTVYAYDFMRCPSLTSTSNLSGINFTFTGYDFLGRKQTSTIAGPNNNTVYAPKAFLSILSIVPNTTDSSHNVTAGSSDIFGLSWCVKDATYALSVKWNNQFAPDTGTLTVADTTSPATASTGDPRGTYAPSSASNGSKRLCVLVHMDASQCGPQGVATNALGVTPA